MNLDSTDATGRQHRSFHNETLSALAGLIPNGLGRPPLDMTGLRGPFDFAFVLPPWNHAEGPLGDHVVSDVFPEIQRQSGLRVQVRTAPQTFSQSITSAFKQQGSAPKPSSMKHSPPVRIRNLTAQMHI